MGVLCTLGHQYITDSNLSKSVMFRLNVLWLQQQIVCKVLLDMIYVFKFKNNENTVSNL